MVQISKGKNWLKDHPIVLHLLAMLAISLVVIVIVLAMLKLFTRHGKEYPIADMVGKTIYEAQAEDELGLDFVIRDSSYMQGQEGGIILMQEPKAGSVVKKGRKVYVTVTAYSESDATLPDVMNQPMRTALSRLESAGLQGGTLNFVANPNPTRGLESEVLGLYCNGHKIYAGEQVKRGAMIDMEVGLSDQELSKQAMVPMLLGKDARKARKQLLSASLNVGAEHYDRSVKNKAAAVVYRQEPEYTGFAGYPLGSTVELWYREMSKDEIEKMVNEFKVDSSQIPTSQGLDDSVWAAIHSSWDI